MHMTVAERRAAGSKKTHIRTLISGVSLSDMISVMDHRILRKEEFNGRKCWVVQSEPKKDAVPKAR
jgi:hypothetical protein